MCKNSQKWVDSIFLITIFISKEKVQNVILGQTWAHFEALTVAGFSIGVEILIFGEPKFWPYLDFSLKWPKNA